VLFIFSNALPLQKVQQQHQNSFHRYVCPTPLVYPLLLRVHTLAAGEKASRGCGVGGHLQLLERCLLTSERLVRAL